MKIRHQISRQLRHLYRRWLYWQHLRQMQQRLQVPSNNAYTDYLNNQLRRTIYKNDNQLKPRTKYLVDKLVSLIDLNQTEVLCIGCRNYTEIDYLYSKGAGKVIGIDLMSNHPDILVMDMHHMTFPNNSFDVIYSSHSLEHAYDPQQVANEISRVCKTQGIVLIEVPVRYQTRGADLVDLVDHQGIYRLFGSNHIKRLWEEEVYHKYMFIARTVFQIKVDQSN